MDLSQAPSSCSITVRANLLRRRSTSIWYMDNTDEYELKRWLNHCSVLFLSSKPKVDGGIRGTCAQFQTCKLIHIPIVAIILILDVPKHFSKIIAAEEVAVFLGAFEVVVESFLDNWLQAIQFLSCEVLNVYHISCPDDGPEFLLCDHIATADQLLLYKVFLGTLSDILAALLGELTLASRILYKIIQGKLAIDVFYQLLNVFEVVLMHLFTLVARKSFAVVVEFGELGTCLADEDCARRVVMFADVKHGWRLK
jgi:hypothetical protein